MAFSGQGAAEATIRDFMIDIDKLNDCMRMALVSPVAQAVMDKGFLAIAKFQNGHIADPVTRELLKEPGVVIENREEILGMFLDSIHKEIFPNKSLDTD